MEIRNPADIERVAVDEIEVGENHRSLNEGRVAELQKSISDIGLQTPITVWMEPIGDSESPDYQPQLVVGQHRSEACRRLGHRDIAAFVATMDELDRELWRIDENLIRAEKPRFRACSRAFAIATQPSRFSSPVVARWHLSVLASSDANVTQVVS